MDETTINPAAESLEAGDTFDVSQLPDFVQPPEAFGGAPTFRTDEAEAEPEGAEGDESAPEGDEAEPEGAEGEGDSPPETLTLDGAEVPVVELAAARTEVADLRGMVVEAFPDKGAELPLRNVVDAGIQYASLMAQFNAGPEGAAQVIEEVLSAAIAEHGPELERFEEVRLAALDPQSLDPVGQSLYGMLKRAQKQVVEVGQAMAAQAEELKAAVAELARNKNAGKYASLIKAAHPDADVDGETALQLMQKHKTEDPVAAYRLEHMDDLLGKARAEGHNSGRTAQGAPRQPKGATAGAIGIDPNLSLREIEAKLRRQAEGA